MGTSATRSRLLKAASIGAIATAALGVTSAAHASTQPTHSSARFGPLVNVNIDGIDLGGLLGGNEHGAHAHHHSGPQGVSPRGFSGGNWGGYVSLDGNFSTTTASWTEPSMSCRSSDDLVAPWVGIDGEGSSTVEQTGVATDCSSGSPSYAAWYEMYPDGPVYYNDPVSAGDQFTGTVTVTDSGQYKLTLVDDTKGWTETVNKSLQASNASAEAVIESPTDSYPAIDGGINFTGVRFNGQNLSDTSPQEVDADDRGSNTFAPGQISNGTDFNVSEQ